jgi:hypothetical protein
MKIKCCVTILLAGILLLSTIIACGNGPALDYTGSDLRINTKSLPAWIEGNYGAFSVNATGGIGKKTWTGTPPSPWVLSTSGVISGTAPLLPSGTSMWESPPFTVTVIDEAKHAREATYSIVVMPRSPKITPKTIAVTWDENAPPTKGIIDLAIISDGVPPYRMSIGSGFPPFGMSVGIDANGVTLQLKGPPTVHKGTYTLQVAIADSNNLEATADVTITIIEAKPKEEVFIGTYSGSWGKVSNSRGAQWSHLVSGTMTLTLVTNSDGTVSGTANVPSDCISDVIYSPPDFNTTGGTNHLTATGTVSGTNTNLAGIFIGPWARYPQYPLKISFTGMRSGDKITGSMIVDGTSVSTINGEIDTITPLSTTVNIVLTK